MKSHHVPISGECKSQVCSAGLWGGRAAAHQVGRGGGGLHGLHAREAGGGAGLAHRAALALLVLRDLPELLVLLVAARVDAVEPARSASGMNVPSWPTLTVCIPFLWSDCRHLQCRMLVLNFTDSLACSKASWRLCFRRSNSAQIHAYTTQSLAYQEAADYLM